MKPLPTDQLRRVEVWGMTVGGPCYVFRPSTVEGILDAFDAARNTGKTVAIKGGGNSYGDAFLNREAFVLDLSRMRRILEWNPATGVIQVEPGATIADVWQYVLEDGWWPPVVSGTAAVTFGGALAANIHGKNNYQAGPIGEHVRAVWLLTPGGDVLPLSPSQNSELFYAVIGGFGGLGVVVAAEIQLKKVYSGLLDVSAFATGRWVETLDRLDELAQSNDYAVGWVDGFALGARAGRAILHSANYLKDGDDPHPEESLSVEFQQIPATVFGIPKTALPRLLRPWVRPLTMRWINSLKYRSGKRQDGHRFRQGLAPFNFLLDSIPNWKHAYRPAGLVQYQVFTPKESSSQLFPSLIAMAHEHGFPPFLAVLKRHRPDPFLLSHAVDGYSLALDFRVHGKRWEKFLSLANEMTELALAAGSRFYLAKDSVLSSDQYERAVGTDAVQQYRELKSRLDPEGLLSSELLRRVLLKG
ncbi:MAG: FAD-binding protein [Fimbriimonadales bacterium]|nr:MAG: FAD-binding protein [Fimbriimonadales bacterium]